MAMPTLDSLRPGYPTYVFTDIKGSSVITRLMEAAKGLGAYETDVRDRQRKHLFGLAGENWGEEIEGRGDGHFFWFNSPDDALDFAVAFQRALRNDPILVPSDSGEKTLEVRVGIHTSKVYREPRPRGPMPTSALPEGTIEAPGSDTNYAARVCGLANGGQILISNEAFQRAGSKGRHRLAEWLNRLIRDWEDEPHTVYELLFYDGQQPTEPGARWAPNWYLGESNRYVDRPAMEAGVFALFRGKSRDGSGSRLVTIKAEGGMGKTRLAIACASRMGGLFSHGVYYVPLASVARDAAAVAERIAIEFDLSGADARPEALVKALADREVLLVLDNCESVADDGVAGLVRDLVNETRHLRVLATSRAPIGVGDLEQTLDLDDGMTDAEGRELFLARARLKSPNIPDSPSKTDSDAIDKIVKLTVGIPLALELAAAWVRPPHTIPLIAQDLEKSPLGRMMTTPKGWTRADSKTTEGRHDTLTASFDWSLKMLAASAGDDACRLFAASGLFEESFTREALAAITRLDDIFQPFQDAVDACLIRMDKKSDPLQPRFRLHRFAREYARETLKKRPEAGEIRKRFADYYAAMVRENAEKLRELSRLALMDLEWRNALAAFDIAEKDGHLRAFRSLADLTFYLDFRGLWSEDERQMLRVLAMAKSMDDRKWEGGTLNNLGIVYDNQGRWDEAIQTYERSLVILREFGDRRSEGASLNNLGEVYRKQGRWDEAIDAYERSLVIYRECGDRRGEGQTLSNLGIVYRRQGRWDEAIDAYERSLVIRREYGDRPGEGQTLNNMAIVYESQGRWDEAIDAYEGDLAICREYGDRRGEGQTLDNVALLWEARGEPARGLPYAKLAVAALETTEATADLEQARATLARLEAACG